MGAPGGITGIVGLAPGDAEVRGDMGDNWSGGTSPGFGVGEICPKELGSGAIWY